MNGNLATPLLIAVCSLSSGVAYSTADQGATPQRAAAAPATGTLDLRPPDLHSMSVQLPPEATFPADADEMLDVAIVSAPPRPVESSNTHLSRSGIGSIYWAARHHAQAWRVLLPVVPGDGSAAFEDLRVECATFVRSPAGQTACR
jgi:hypothetical protein